MREILDVTAIRRWSEVARDGLARTKAEIDDINVYPVPDGDTGTNLYLTMEAAAEAVGTVTAEDLEAVLRALAEGAFIGARGNSGVITSQLLRGLADGLVTADPVDGVALASALGVAADLGYVAVAEPVEGTILTVARAAAAAAQAADGHLTRVATAAADGATQALLKTPEQLDVLRQAGVVDAGGLGLCVILDALAEVVTGVVRVARTPPLPQLRRSSAAAAVSGRANRAGPAAAIPAGIASPSSPVGAPPVEAGSGGPSYEVMYLLEAPDSAIPTLKSKLAPQGDSLVVVGGGGRWNVHIHVDDPGPAVEAGVTAGRPHRIKITNLVDPAHRGGSHRETRRAVVALASPPGLVTIFEETGAMVVQHDPDRPPGTSALLAAITATSAQQVVVIADAENTVAVADAAAAQARDDGVRVAVIPAGSCVQAIAALAVHEPAHDFDADVIAMSGAAGGARHAEVTIATSEAVTSAGLCRAGDVLGLIEGDVAQIGSDVAEVSVSILQRMLDAGGELVTLVTGAAAPANLGERLAGKLHTQRPEVECVVYDGGQADYPLLIGVE